MNPSPAAEQQASSSSTAVSEYAATHSVAHGLAAQTPVINRDAKSHEAAGKEKVTDSQDETTQSVVDGSVAGDGDAKLDQAVGKDVKVTDSPMPKEDEESNAPGVASAEAVELPRSATSDPTGPRPTQITSDPNSETIPAKEVEKPSLRVTTGDHGKLPSNHGSAESAGQEAAESSEEEGMLAPEEEGQIVESSSSESSKLPAISTSTATPTSSAAASLSQRIAPPAPLANLAMNNAADLRSSRFSSPALSPAASHMEQRPSSAGRGRSNSPSASGWARRPPVAGLGVDSGNDGPGRERELSGVPGSSSAPRYWPQQHEREREWGNSSNRGSRAEWDTYHGPRSARGESRWDARDQRLDWNPNPSPGPDRGWGERDEYRDRGQTWDRERERNRWEEARHRGDRTSVSGPPAPQRDRPDDMYRRNSTQTPASLLSPHEPARFGWGRGGGGAGGPVNDEPTPIVPSQPHAIVPSQQPMVPSHQIHRQPFERKVSPARSLGAIFSPRPDRPPVANGFGNERDRVAVHEKDTGRASSPSSRAEARPTETASHDNEPPVSEPPLQPTAEQAPRAQSQQPQPQTPIETPMETPVDAGFVKRRDELISRALQSSPPAAGSEAKDSPAALTEAAARTAETQQRAEDEKEHEKESRRAFKEETRRHEVLSLSSANLAPGILSRSLSDKSTTPKEQFASKAPTLPQPIATTRLSATPLPLPASETITEAKLDRPVEPAPTEQETTSKSSTADVKPAVADAVMPPSEISHPIISVTETGAAGDVVTAVVTQVAASSSTSPPTVVVGLATEEMPKSAHVDADMAMQDAETSRPDADTSLQAAPDASMQDAEPEPEREREPAPERQEQEPVGDADDGEQAEEAETADVEAEGDAEAAAEAEAGGEGKADPQARKEAQKRREQELELAVRKSTLHLIQSQATCLADPTRRVMKENKMTAMTTHQELQARSVFPEVYIEQGPLWLQDDDDEARIVKHHIRSIELKKQKRLSIKIERLRRHYKKLDSEWKNHCAFLDRWNERKEKKSVVHTSIGTPAAEVEFSAPLLATPVSGRANRRSMNSGFAGFGDAVRSEAEFLEILASLENADMQDPTMRAARTTATVPDMLLDPQSSKLVEDEYDDNNGYIADPIAFYLSDFDPDYWSDKEKTVFLRKYALYPKQFGKIASFLEHKTTQQCVTFYYATKKLPNYDYKGLAAARNRERKRKVKPKPKKAKGSALLADLRPDNGDVEDSPAMSSISASRRKVSAADSLAPIDEDQQPAPASVNPNRKRRATEDQVPGEANKKRSKKARKPKEPRNGSVTAEALAGGEAEQRDLAAASALEALAGGLAEKAPKKDKKVKAVDGGATEESKKKSRSYTSSYWSVAERSAFLQSLATNGKHWTEIASSLKSKSAAQARNFYSRNHSDADFVEATTMSERNAALSLEERSQQAADLVARISAAAAAVEAEQGAVRDEEGLATSQAEHIHVATPLPQQMPSRPRMGAFVEQTPASQLPEPQREIPTAPPPRGFGISSLLNDEPAAPKREMPTIRKEWYSGYGAGEEQHRRTPMANEEDTDEENEGRGPTELPERESNYSQYSAAARESTRYAPDPHHPSVPSSYDPSYDTGQYIAPTGRAVFQHRHSDDHLRRSMQDTPPHTSSYERPTSSHERPTSSYDRPPSLEYRASPFSQDASAYRRSETLPPPSNHVRRSPPHLSSTLPSFRASPLPSVSSGTYSSYPAPGASYRSRSAASSTVLPPLSSFARGADEMRLPPPPQQDRSCSPSRSTVLPPPPPPLQHGEERRTNMPPPHNGHPAQPAHYPRYDPARHP